MHGEELNVICDCLNQRPGLTTKLNKRVKKAYVLHEVLPGEIGGVGEASMKDKYEAFLHTRTLMLCIWLTKIKQYKTLVYRSKKNI